MADHAREQLRDHCHTQILNGGTTAGSRVHDSRVWPYGDSDLPALAVYSPEDRTVTSPSQAGHVERVMILRVEGRAKANSAMEHTLDELDKETQEILLADTFLGGKCKDITHASTTIELSGEQDKPVGRMTADYEITYRIAQATPDVLL
jgi:hypothetical protein